MLKLIKKKAPSTSLISHTFMEWKKVAHLLKDDGIQQGRLLQLEIFGYSTIQTPLFVTTNQAPKIKRHN